MHSNGAHSSIHIVAYHRRCWLWFLWPTSSNKSNNNQSPFKIAFAQYRKRYTNARTPTKYHANLLFHFYLIKYWHWHATTTTTSTAAAVAAAAIQAYPVIGHHNCNAKSSLHLIANVVAGICSQINCRLACYRTICVRVTTIGMIPKMCMHFCKCACVFA